MATNDNKQTHKQYVARKKRIQTSQEYDKKIENVSNEIQDIDEQINQLNALKENKMMLQKQIKDEKYQAMLVLYNEDGLVDEIVTMSEQTTCSHSMVADIKQKCKKGVNEDDVDLNIIENMISVDETILRQVPHTNIIGDLLNIIGESIAFPGEEDEEDDT